MKKLSAALAAAVTRVAEPGGLAYTERQLYYELCRALPSGWHRRLSGLRHLPVAWLHRLPYHLVTPLPPLPYVQFQAALADYRTAQGTPPGLLIQPRTRFFDPKAQEPDLFDYGLPRLLLVQQPAVAAMLLANHLHMDLPCAILPLAAATPLPDALCAMLVRAGEAQVYLLHDATSEGLALIHGLRTALALPDRVRLTVLGLRPRDLLRLHIFAQQGPEQLPPRDAPWFAHLTPAERTWLQAGYYGECEALRPAHLLRSLRRSLTPPRVLAQPTGNSRLTLETTFMSWPTI